MKNKKKKKMEELIFYPVIFLVFCWLQLCLRESSFIMWSSHELIPSLVLSEDLHDAFISFCVSNVCACSQTCHFFDLSLGGGFRGIKNSALIGCMSQSAMRRRTQQQMVSRTQMRRKNTINATSTSTPTCKSWTVFYFF